MKKLQKIAAAIFSAATLCGALHANTLPVQTILNSVVLTAHADASLSGYCGDRQINDGKDVTWKLEDGVLTISGTGAMADYPNDNPGWYSYRESIKSAEIEDGVTSIGEYAFYKCSTLTEVTIPDSVTSIGNSAFGFCSSLKSVTVPGSVTGIGQSAFSDCSSLHAITISEGVIRIGMTAFFHCTGLTSVIIPGSVTSISSGAFYSCENLKSVVLMGDTPPELSENAFYSTHNSLKIYVPETDVVTYKTAWSDCADRILSSTLYIWDCGAAGDHCKATLYADGTLTITGTGEMADFGDDNPEWYPYCESIKRVVIENGVTSIGASAFDGCTRLTSVTIPNGVTSIADFAFFNCTGLTSVVIPDSVKSIGESAFEGCSNLTSVIIPDGVTEIRNYTFYGCSGLTFVNIPESVTDIGVSAFDGCISLTSVIIPKGVTSIGEYAFCYCTGLTFVSIPDSVRYIGDYVFGDCSSLKSVFLAGDTPPALGDDVFESTPNDLIIYVPDDAVAVYTSEWSDYADQILSSILGVWNCGDEGNNCTAALTADGTLTIRGTGEMADYKEEPWGWFSERESITSVVIEDGVTGIGHSAFAQCSNVSAVTIPDSVTSIRDNAFYNCQSLKYITIPDSVTSIGSSAFYACKSLESVALEGETPPEIGADAFYGSHNDLKIIVPAEAVNDYKNAWSNYADRITSGIIGEWNCGAEGDHCKAILNVYGTLTISGTGAMADYSQDEPGWYSCRELITSVVIENGVTSIGASAFYDCTNLSSVTIPESVTSIGQAAFYYCDGLISVTIPDGVTNIEDSVFYGCSGLTSVTIPDGVTNIEDSVFYGCSGLTSVTIPDGVTTIGDSSFAYCSKLSEITIPESGARIGAAAFSRCSSLKSVFLKGETPPELGDKAFNSTHNDLKIYVPASAVAAYKTKWNKYADRIIARFPYVWDCGAEGDHCKASLDADGTLTVSGTGAMANCNGYPDWYSYADSITNVVIENGVTSIGDYAFNGHKSLNSVTIPDSVTDIGTEAFYLCENLKSVIFEGETPPELGRDVFGCTHIDLKILVPAGTAAAYKTAWSKYEDRIIENKLLPEDACYPVDSNGVNKIHVGFSVNVPEGSEVLDYGLIYYNSGTVITTPYLTLENVGICGIKKANYYTANITDKGYGVVCVGYVQIRNADQTVDTYYTGELGGSYEAMTNAAKYVTLTKQENKAVISGGKQKVYVGFDANVPNGYTVEDYGLIYYNSGNVIHTEHLTLENVGICGINKAKYWGANITDNGYGVTAVGYVKVKDALNKETVIYSEELGGSYAAVSEAAAEKAVTLTRQQNKAVVSGGKNKVYVGFNANVAEGYTVEDYGLIYYNSGNVIHTEHLTLDNVGVCGISKAKYWGANITDIGYGVTAVGFVTVEDSNGCVTTLYTEELGGSFTAISEAAAANAVTLTRQANKAIVSGGKNKVYVGFNANVAEGYTVEDFGLIYYNSGNVIHTEHLTLDNVGICGIQKAKYWGANITDNGYGVTAVGFVTVKNANGYVTTLYTGELGAKFAELPH